MRRIALAARRSGGESLSSAIRAGIEPAGVGRSRRRLRRRTGRAPDLSPFDAALAWKIEDALLERWRGLEWIQLVSAGADPLLSLPALRPGVVVTSVRGIHANPIAGYVMMMLSACP